MQPFRLGNNSKQEVTQKGKSHKQSVSDPTQWRGGSAACPAALHPGVPEQSGGTWGLGQSSPGFPGGDPSGNQALPDRQLDLERKQELELEQE